jgi:excinuclease UvrABC nuclease subunit
MFAGEPSTLDCTPDRIDAEIEALPNSAAVFVIWPREGEPYLARTTMLRRRLKRLLRDRGASRLLNLRTLAARLEYWPAASRLEMSLASWELARRFVPERYVEYLKLRMPPYVRLVLGNEYPRTQVTTKLGGGPGLWYGPFRTRAAAEEFEHGFLDMFQLRRCQEDLQPAASHPGCMYGEMNMCLRPCQQVVGPAEYASEVARVADFLSTSGRHLLEAAEHARDRLSGEMEFERAAQQHKRIERIQQVLRLRDDIASDIDSLHGVAVLPSVVQDTVRLEFLLHGAWQPPVTFPAGANVRAGTSLDHRLRDVVAQLEPYRPPPKERQEHLALFARWYFSSWRDGSWLPMTTRSDAPWRRLVSAVSRAAAAALNVSSPSGM